MSSSYTNLLDELEKLSKNSPPEDGVERQKLADALRKASLSIETPLEFMRRVCFGVSSDPTHTVINEIDKTFLHVSHFKLSASNLEWTLTFSASWIKMKVFLCTTSYKRRVQKENFYVSACFPLPFKPLLTDTSVTNSALAKIPGRVWHHHSTYRDYLRSKYHHAFLSH